VHRKQRQNTRMNYAVEMCGNEYSLNGTIARDVRTHKFRHLHLRHFVRLPHLYHSLENSRTFQDPALKFPGLSRTKLIFQDFPGPGNCIQKNPGLSRSMGTLNQDPRSRSRILPIFSGDFLFQGYIYDKIFIKIQSIVFTLLTDTQQKRKTNAG